MALIKPKKIANKNGCFKKTRCLIEWNLNDNDDAKKQFEIVGSCGHELLLPELLQLLNRPDLEGFSAGVKISDECSIKGSRINRLGCFFLNTHITNIYRYHNHIHRNIKVNACFGELCFSFFLVSCGADGNQ